MGSPGLRWREDPQPAPSSLRSPMACAFARRLGNGGYLPQGPQSQPSRRTPRACPLPAARAPSRALGLRGLGAQTPGAPPVPPTCPEPGCTLGSRAVFPPTPHSQLMADFSTRVSAPRGQAAGSHRGRSRAAGSPAGGRKLQQGQAGGPADTAGLGCPGGAPGRLKTASQTPGSDAHSPGGLLRSSFRDHPPGWPASSASSPRLTVAPGCTLDISPPQQPEGSCLSLDCPDPAPWAPGEAGVPGNAPATQPCPQDKVPRPWRRDRPASRIPQDARLEGAPGHSPGWRPMTRLQGQCRGHSRAGPARDLCLQLSLAGLGLAEARGPPRPGLTLPAADKEWYCLQGDVPAWALPPHYAGGTPKDGERVPVGPSKSHSLISGPAFSSVTGAAHPPLVGQGAVSEASRSSSVSRGPVATLDSSSPEAGRGLEARGGAPGAERQERMGSPSCSRPPGGLS